MYHLMMNMPVFATLGVFSLLAGPLAKFAIVSGAWMLERGLHAGSWAFGRCVSLGHRFDPAPFNEQARE